MELLVECLNLLQGMLFLGQKLPGIFHRQQTSFIEGKLVFAAVKKRDAECLLHVLHGTGERRLGDMQSFGCLGKRSAVGEDGQLFQFREIEHSQPSFLEIAIHFLKSRFPYFYCTFFLICCKLLNIEKRNEKQIIQIQNNRRKHKWNM